MSLGVVPPGRDLGDHRVRPGDVVIASGTLGDHGATIGRVAAPTDGGSAVVMRTLIGGERPLDHLSGADLPRIC